MPLEERHPTPGDSIRAKMPISCGLEPSLAFVFREIGFLIATCDLARFASNLSGRAVIRKMAWVCGLESSLVFVLRKLRFLKLTAEVSGLAPWFDARSSTRTGLSANRGWSSPSVSPPN